MPKLLAPPPMLALDMASKTGWAHTSGVGGMVEIPTINRKLKHNGHRFHWILGWLDETVMTYRTGIIVYEAGSHKGGGDAMRLGVGLATTLELFCYRKGIELRPLNTSKIKKHATGNGHAKKHDMLAAARKKWSLKYFDDNYIDAKWILDYGITLWRDGSLL